jgi:hypothetical protein
MSWPLSIVRPSVWGWISPFAHWCRARFLQLPHQCVHLLCSRTAFPIWEGPWCRLPCRGWRNQWGWRNSIFTPKYSRQFPRGNEPIGPLAANNSSRSKCMMVKFTTNYLWHDADACPQITKSMLKVLSSYWTCDGGGILGPSCSPGEDRV